MLATTTRAWQLGTLAGEMAQARFRRNRATAAGARLRVVERMGALHGLPQKVGQILSLSELSNQEATYTPLTEYRPTVPAAEAFAEMEKHLGRRLSDCFGKIEGVGISASLGQVHRGVLCDGRPVAVKFQYPGIAEALRVDLRALGWLTVPLGGYKRGFDLRAYRQEVGAMLQQELDYRREARMMKKFAAMTADAAGVAVPEIIEELSGDAILTMTWLDGEPFSAVRRWTLPERRQVSQTLLRLFLNSCFRWGCLHADPHPGNYRFLRRERRPAVGLLDFGCVKELDPVTMNALAGLVQDVVEDKIGLDPDRALARYAAMGFHAPVLEPLAPALGPLTRLLFRPFRPPQPFSLSSWRLGERVEELLGKYRWNFRFAAPASLIYAVRAYQGLLEYLQALDAPVDWREIWEELRPAFGKTPRLSRGNLSDDKPGKRQPGSQEENHDDSGYELRSARREREGV